MNKLLKLTLLLPGLLLFAACGDDTAVSGVVLNNTALVLPAGSSEAIVATVEPSTAVNQTLHWTTSDANIAVVSNGTVTALAEGVATITVTTDDGGFTAQCAVTVQSVAVTGIILSREAGFLSVNDTLVLIPTVLPAVASNKNVTWSSADHSVATVTGGTVTAVANGATTIIATTEDGQQMAACAITVNWLGKAVFKTDKTWTVGGQTWSDAVVASGCKKQEYDGGPAQGPVYKADCKDNAAGYGDLFSWEAVNQYKKQLCPNGWRVPTADDYCMLDKTLNSREVCDTRTDPEARDRYLSDTWGGEYGGITRDGELYYTGESAYYWSQSESSATTGVYSYFGSLYDIVAAAETITKNTGFTVRCVKE